jgi:hypothetical protein
MTAATIPAIATPRSAAAAALTYASEGLRAAVTSQPHLSLLVVYPVLAAATGLLVWQSTHLFTRRVIG